MGRGISAAVGITLANKYKNNNYYTLCNFVVMERGNLKEGGQVYEAPNGSKSYQLSHFILFLTIMDYKLMEK